MQNLISRFAGDEDGATAIEYGLIAGLIAVAIIGGLNTLQGGLTGLLNFIGGQLTTAAN